MSIPLNPHTNIVHLPIQGTNTLCGFNKIYVPCKHTNHIPRITHTSPSEAWLKSSSYQGVGHLSSGLVIEIMSSIPLLIIGHTSCWLSTKLKEFSGTRAAFKPKSNCQQGIITEEKGISASSI